jgi:hypothetical protein
VSILDNRDIVTGKKKANDAAYKLASHLLAAQLNFAAGAKTCQDALDAAIEAENLLVSLGFNGTADYLSPKDSNYQIALELAETLDQYNNGILCNPPPITENKESTSNTVVTIPIGIPAGVNFVAPGGITSNAIAGIKTSFSQPFSLGNTFSGTFGMSTNFSPPFGLALGQSSGFSPPFGLGLGQNSGFSPPFGLGAGSSGLFGMSTSFSPPFGLAFGQSSGFSPPFGLGLGQSSGFSPPFGLGSDFSGPFGMGTGFSPPFGLGAGFFRAFGMNTGFSSQFNGNFLLP